jgi:putative flippase GtrA
MKQVKAYLDTLSPLHRQIARFIFTGGVNAIFAYAAFAFFSGLAGADYLPAVFYAWCCGVTFSYVTFRAFVFTDGNRSFSTFAKFIPTYIILLLVNLAMMYMLVGKMGWHELVAQGVVIPFCAMLSFFFNRMFVFRKKT